MTKIIKQPKFIRIAGWLITLFAFAIGFWHTHLGLRSFEILSSSNGSLIASALILLVLLVSYYSAVHGKKNAFVFYVICAIFYFTFNMTSLYPNRLGRKLVKEEAIVINDSLQSFTAKVNRDFGKDQVTKNVNSITDLKKLLVNEIIYQSGFGERSKDYLNQINAILGPPYIKPNIRIGSTIEERTDIANRVASHIDERLKSYEVENVGAGKVAIIDRINELKSIYEPKLSQIISDNSKINIDSIRANVQINTMQELVTKMDNICIDANKISSQTNSNQKSPFFTVYGEVKSQYLGTFEHTISSVCERINKIDTWGIIIFCLFIDFVVPLSIYFLIRTEDGYIEDNTTITLWRRLIGKPTPSEM